MVIIGKYILAEAEIPDTVIIHESNDFKHTNCARVIAIGDEVIGISVGDYVHISDLDGEHLDRKNDPSKIVLRQEHIIMVTKTPDIRIIEELDFYDTKSPEREIII